MGIFSRLFGSPKEQGNISHPNRYPVGLVAGIEAVKIDEAFHFFAFSHSNDIVVSPLFADAKTMSEYAAKNLTQRDGHHDASYWLQITEYATTESELFETVPEVDTSEIRRFLDVLATAEQTSEEQPDIPRISFIEYTVLGLDTELQVQPNWAAYSEIIRELGIDHDEFYGAEAATLIAHIAGEETYFEGKPVGASAQMVRACLSAILKMTDDSWRSAFPDLVGGEAG